MKIANIKQMRALDQRAIESHGIPEVLLMENAGLAAVEVIRRTRGENWEKTLVICGLGNNGGDGWVVARKLLSYGAEVLVAILGDPERYQGAARTNYQAARASGVTVLLNPDMNQLDEAIASCELIVDALFGTGITRAVGGRHLECIGLINRSSKPVYALDIPSGVDGDTGAIRGVAVQADHTITFGLPKLGNLLYPGASLGGQLWVSHISFPPPLTRSEEIHVSLLKPTQLPPRKTYGHKGGFGEALFFAGAEGYYGAPALAAEAFLRAGGGYSRLATPAEVARVVAARAPELVFHPLEATSSGGASLQNHELLQKLCERVDVVVLGPGLSLDVETQELVRSLISQIDKPLILDGDGLTAIVHSSPETTSRLHATILTPHAGEMARLLSAEVSEILADPVRAIRRCATRYGATVVFKGAHSLVCGVDGEVFVNLSGNSGMASPGSGDVLAGMIAALIGLGIEPGDATKTAVFLHGVAGDLAAKSLGEDGMLARDTLKHVPETMRRFRASPYAIEGEYLGRVRLV